MDVFEYIATANPSACQDLCARYGYQAQAATTADLGDCMSILVEQEGEPALRDLMGLHPDKEVLLEQFGQGATSSGGGKCGCGCGSCQGKKGGGAPGAMAQWIDQGRQLTHTHQAGLFILGGLFVMSLAIISIKS